MLKVIHKKMIFSKVSQGSFAKQQGVTLIESVVALLIFSVGAIGLAAMQLTSLSASGDSQQRSIAIWKAQEFVDRIKSNKSIVNQYITSIGNTDFTSIGLDTAVGRLDCANFAQPAGNKFCADSPTATAAQCTDNADKVNYDIWDVFCNAESGLASSGANAVNTIGVTDLEIGLRQNTVAANGDDDYLLVFEWASRETENNADIQNTQTLSTSLCGEAAQNVASNLDVYCLRFRL